MRAALLAGALFGILPDNTAEARPDPKARARVTDGDAKKPAPPAGPAAKHALTSGAASRERTRTLASRASSTSAALAIAQPGLLPERWLPSNGRECITRGRLRGFCQGPRRVPEPHGAAARRAVQLEMGARDPAARLLLRGPPAPWVRAAAETPAARRWLRPLEDGRLLRGLAKLPAKAAGATSPMNARGVRRKPHAGLDLRAAEGSLIRAAQSGVVVYSDNRISGYGNLVMVVHGDASVALYGHCRATYVFPGQQVERGQIIAEVGQTGYALGPHLHFEYRVAGRPRDPTPLFSR